MGRRSRAGRSRGAQLAVLAAAALLLAGAAAGAFGPLQHKDAGKSAINADKLDGHDASDLLTPNNLSQVLDEGNSVGNNNLDMNGQAISNWLSSGCASGQAVDDITDGGSISCVSISGESANVYVNESGDVMTGDLNMSEERIMKIGANKTNFTSWGRLDMGEIIDMNSNQIKNLADPTSSADAMTQGYADSEFLRRTSSDSMEGDLDMLGNRIENVDAIGNGTTRTITMTASGGVTIPNGYLNVSSGTDLNVEGGRVVDTTGTLTLGDGDVEVPNGRLGVQEASPSEELHVTDGGEGDAWAQAVFEGTQNDAGVGLVNPRSQKWILLSQGNSGNAPDEGDFEVWDDDASQTALRIRNGTNDVVVPNGDLDIESNSVVNQTYLIFNDEDGDGVSWRMNEDGGNGKFRVFNYDGSTSTAVLRATTGNTVEIPNGNLDFAGDGRGIQWDQSYIEELSSNWLRIATSGGGDGVYFYDQQHQDELIQANEGGPVMLKNSISGEVVLQGNYSGGSNVEIPNGDLEFNSNNNIIGSGGNSRLGLGGTYTDLRYSDGTDGVRLRDDNLIIQHNGGEYAFLSDDGQYASRLVARSGEPTQIEDRQGANTIAVEYTSAHPGPGTFTFQNATLDMAGNEIKATSSGYRSAPILRHGFYIQGAVGATETPSAGDAFVWHEDGTGNTGADGDVIIRANDDSGSGSKSGILFDYSAGSVSSARFKENISTVSTEQYNPSALADVPVKQWTDEATGEHHFGFVAEDLYAAEEDSVITTKLTDDMVENGTVSSEYMDRYGYEINDTIPHQVRHIPLLAAHQYELQRHDATIRRLNETVQHLRQENREQAERIEQLEEENEQMQQVLCREHPDASFCG